MAEDVINRGGRRMRAGAKPDPLKDAKCGFLVGVFHEGGRGGIPACW